MKQLLFLIAAIILSSAACQAQTTTSTISSTPATAVMAETPEVVNTQRSSDVESLVTVTVPASPTSAVTNTPTPTSTEVTLTRTPTNTPTSGPTSTPTNVPPVPPADIEIQAPGALSKVISPIPVRALLVPGHRGRVSIELFGEDGRVITRQIIILNPNLGRKAGMVIELPFEIPTEAEFSRLVISRQDEYGRTTALASTELVLLSSGQPDYNVVVDNLAPVTIQEPQLNAIIQGDSLVVSGMARPAIAMDYVIELVAQNGKVISQRVFNVSTSSPGEHQSFIVEVPYSIEDPTWVIVLIRERGDRIQGITYLTSTEVLLSP